MKQNLNSKNQALFKSLENRILSLNNTNDITEEINIFSKTIPMNGIVNNLLESLSNEKYYVPNNSVHNKITLFTSSNYEFSLIHNPPKAKVDKGAVPLYTYTGDVFFCPLIDVPDSRYTIYEQKKLLEPNVLDTNAKLQVKTENIFTKNKTICLKKFKELLSLDETKPVLFLMIASKKSSIKYSWEYNSISLKPTRIVLRDINYARLGATAKILGNIGDQNSMDLLLRLSQHKSHIVRWEAVRALINIDFDEGSSMLKKMTKDEHIEISMAAKRSVQMLNI